jgi:hypothetical protein
VLKYKVRAPNTATAPIVGSVVAAAVGENDKSIAYTVRLANVTGGGVGVDGVVGGSVGGISGSGGGVSGVIGVGAAAGVGSGVGALKCLVAFPAAAAASVESASPPARFTRHANAHRLLWNIDAISASDSNDNAFDGNDVNADDSSAIAISERGDLENGVERVVCLRAQVRAATTAAATAAVASPPPAALSFRYIPSHSSSSSSSTSSTSMSSSSSSLPSAVRVCMGGVAAATAVKSGSYQLHA